MKADTVLAERTWQKVFSVDLVQAVLCFVFSMNLLAVLRCEWRERGFPDHHTAEVSRWKVRNPDLVLLTGMMTIRKEKNRIALKDIRRGKINVIFYLIGWRDKGEERQHGVFQLRQLGELWKMKLRDLVTRSSFRYIQGFVSFHFLWIALMSELNLLTSKKI